MKLASKPVATRLKEPPVPRYFQSIPVIGSGVGSFPLGVNGTFDLIGLIRPAEESSGGKN